MNSRISFRLLTYILLLGNQAVFARTIYVNSSVGLDSNSGFSLDFPIKTLARLSEFSLNAGDSILLAAGQEFEGSIVIKDFLGAPDSPLVVSSYPLGEQKALINAKGRLSAILVENSSHVVIHNLALTANAGALESPDQAMRCGALLVASAPGSFEGFLLSNLHIYDVFYEEPGYVRGKAEVQTANGSQHYGWGIRVINRQTDAQLSGVVIDNVVVQNVAHTGIKFTGESHGELSISRVVVSNSTVSLVGGPGIQLSGVTNAHIHHNKVDQSGSNDDSRKWGRGSGLWTWGCDSVVVERNEFINAKGPGDSAGAHIDYNCKNIVFQYNLSMNNAGGFCEILGNNHNCSYRYNISVNDGYRQKGLDGAFQEGKLFWLSGYVGKAPKCGPFNSYFYNNTMYVKRDIPAKMAIDLSASGVLVANNIFCVEGESRMVRGDQDKTEEKKGAAPSIANTIFSNNLFLSSDNWPSDSPIQPKGSSFGDPKFRNSEGTTLADFIPNNRKLIRDKGMVIGLIPQDSVGLEIGLEVTEDILGNPIVGLPDLGAIELQ